jgi:hypothetical protein
MPKWLPRYPIYIPSRGRAATPITIRTLARDNVPFRVVVEREEADEYSALVGAENVLVLPRSSQGLIYARNWIKEHSLREGAERHWQLDDNIKRMMALFHKRRIQCDAGLALRVCEDFTDRYTNVAISGLNYAMFMFRQDGRDGPPPFYVNHHVYSCSLILNSTPYRWRTFYNDDTDMCLQVLSENWCTLLLNAFLCDKEWTMKVSGGNTPVYQGDGRLKMAQAMERIWPGVVSVGRRFQRPQHVVKHQWRRFDTPLIPKDPMPAPIDYGIRLAQVGQVKARSLQALVDQRLSDAN